MISSEVEDHTLPYRARRAGLLRAARIIPARPLAIETDAAVAADEIIEIVGAEHWRRSAQRQDQIASSGGDEAEVEPRRPGEAACRRISALPSALAVAMTCCSGAAPMPRQRYALAT